MHDEATRRFMEDSGVPGAGHAHTVKPKDVLKVFEAAISPNPLRKLTKVVVKKGVSAILINDNDKMASDEVSQQHAISIYKELNERYHSDWQDWEPETVAQTLLSEFGDDLGPEGLGLIQALQMLCKTNQAHENWHVFEKVCLALSGLPVDFSSVQPVEPQDLFHAMRVMDAIRPKEDYESEVYGYAAACLKNAGMVWVPPEFSPGAVHIQEKLDDMNNDLELCDRVRSTWPRLALAEDDAALAIQLGRLHEVKEHLLLLE